MAGVNPKSTQMRFRSFRDEICPYCGSKDAFLHFNDFEVWHGICRSCGVDNKFTGPKIEEWLVK
jgi:Zn ribbon nucleic-acid-binding protein